MWVRSFIPLPVKTGKGVNEYVYTNKSAALRDLNLEQINQFKFRRKIKWLKIIKHQTTDLM